MKKTRIKNYLSIAAVVLLAMAVPSFATTVTLTAVADSWIDEANQGTNYGSDVGLAIKNSGSTNSAKAYMRFELPVDFDTATSVTFKITRGWLGNSWNANYNLHGLNNGTSETWGESTISWNNAPANDGSDYGFGSDATGVLGTFTTLGANYGGAAGQIMTVSTANLLSFINTDSDGNVTLMLGRPSSTTGYDTFAAIGHWRGAAQLELDYTPVPEPATLAILAAGFFFVGNRRKRI